MYKAVASLRNLQTLYAINNGISDLTPISGMVELNMLDLALNDISDVSPLSDLVNLEILDLDCNYIENIALLYSLTSLSELRVRNILSLASNLSTEIDLYRLQRQSYT
ncbi:hypothetical protein BC833DRAFT_407899 [Globomyces pollinis-pini]|nr:hypothetical protein BC833DRAFT_407899 [Globomyces pollinis-pini]